MWILLSLFVAALGYENGYHESFPDLVSPLSADAVCDPNRPGCVPPGGGDPNLPPFHR